MKGRGLFITFEGGEGSGKSTLIRKICEWLETKSLPVILTRQPGGCELGDKIRRILLERGQTPLSHKSELLLFLANRAQHAEEILFPAVEKGAIVLCDRYNDSTRAYQGAARHFDAAFVHQLCEFATEGLEPDLTFWLDIDPAEGLRRVYRESRPETQSGECDRIEAENLPFHQEVRASYAQLQKKEPHRIVRIDGSLSKEEVFAQAVRELEKRLT